MSSYILFFWLPLGTLTPFRSMSSKYAVFHENRNNHNHSLKCRIFLKTPHNQSREIGNRSKCGIFSSKTVLEVLVPDGPLLVQPQNSKLRFQPGLMSPNSRFFLIKFLLIFILFNQNFHLPS